MTSGLMRDARGRYVAATEPPFPDLWECHDDAATFLRALTHPGATCPPYVLLRSSPAASEPGVPPLAYAMRVLVDADMVAVVATAMRRWIDETLRLNAAGHASAIREGTPASTSAASGDGVKNQDTEAPAAPLSKAETVTEDATSAEAFGSWRSSPGLFRNLGAARLQAEIDAGLLSACGAGWANAVEALLKAGGADPACKLSWSAAAAASDAGSAVVAGQTPLHGAAGCGSAACVRLILEALAEGGGVGGGGGGDGAGAVAVAAGRRLDSGGRSALDVAEARAKRLPSGTATAADESALDLLRRAAEAGGTGGDGEGGAFSTLAAAAALDRKVGARASAAYDREAARAARVEALRAELGCLQQWVAGAGPAGLASGAGGGWRAVLVLPEGGAWDKGWALDLARRCRFDLGPGVEAAPDAQGYFRLVAAAPAGGAGGDPSSLPEPRAVATTSAAGEGQGEGATSPNSGAAANDAAADATSPAALRRAARQACGSGLAVVSVLPFNPLPEVGKLAGPQAAAEAWCSVAAIALSKTAAQFSGAGPCWGAVVVACGSVGCAAALRLAEKVELKGLVLVGAGYTAEERARDAAERRAASSARPAYPPRESELICPVDYATIVRNVGKLVLLHHRGRGTGSVGGGAGKAVAAAVPVSELLRLRSGFRRALRGLTDNRDDLDGDEEAVRCAIAMTAASGAGGALAAAAASSVAATAAGGGSDDDPILRVAAAEEAAEAAAKGSSDGSSGGGRSGGLVEALAAKALNLAGVAFSEAEKATKPRGLYTHPNGAVEAVTIIKQYAAGEGKLLETRSLF